MAYGESTVGTSAETQPFGYEDAVTARDGFACLLCGGEEEVSLFLRHPDWRKVPENMFSACPHCSITIGTSLAQANGWTLKSAYGISDVPFLSRDGWVWLAHSGQILTTRPTRKEW